jgi:diaminohydroxyphosphoribosylaminopyrimidine deaminase/5-amino-6-(5-phosphoribosylamino)uracil reductase
MEDPNPRVSGAGFARLRAAGVEVVVGVGEKEARRANEAFVHHLATGRPLVTVKLAVTLDGRVATRTGDSRWVTGPEARALVHRWRAESDAVLVGAGTARADDPQLTARDIGAEGAMETRQPLRVVLDRAGSLPPALRLFSSPAHAPTVAFVGPDAVPGYAGALEAAGGRVISTPLLNDHLDLVFVLEALGAGRALPEGVRTVQSLLVEAGPGLATGLLREDLVDRLFVFVAPKLVGDDGLPAFGAMGIDAMADAPAPVEATWEVAGADVLMRGYLRAV